MDAIRRWLNSLEVYPSWFFVRLLLLAGFSWAVHAAEFELFVFTRRSMAKSIGMTTFAVEAMGGGVFVGAVVGGPLFGYLADARGRRWALLIAKSLSLVGLVLSAIARRDYEIISARILAGIGIGGELPVATVMVHELVPKAMRGRVVSLLEAFSGVGGIVGVVLAFGLAPQLGWRLAYLVICAGICYVGLLCFLIPESPRWLASVGRSVEAVAVMEKLERAHGTRLVYNKFMMQETPIDVVEESEELLETRKLPIFEPARAASTWTLWAVMELSSYTLGVYVPVLISLNGFNMFSRCSTMALFGVAQVCGSVLASLVLEDQGLKKALTCFATSAAVIAVMLSYAPWNGPVVVVGTCTVSALLAGAWSCLLGYTPKTFSPNIRGRGVGYAFGLSKLAAVAGSWFYPRMFNVWLMSVSAITWIFGGLLVAAVFGVVMATRFASHEDVGKDSRQTLRRYRPLVKLGQAEHKRLSTTTRRVFMQMQPESWGHDEIISSTGINSDSNSKSFRWSPLQTDSKAWSPIFTAASTLDARLSWFYVRLLLLTGFSWAVHAAELVLFVFTRRLVAESVGMGTYALESLGAAIFVGAAIGGPLFGHLADIRGRRSALLLAMTLSLAGMALSAMATKHYQVIAARVVAGVGLGEELPAATVLVQELAPRPMRGRMVALLEAFKGVGGVLGVALAFGLAPQLGWRTSYLVIFGLVVYAGVLRLRIPESPRWLASIGRMDEALKAAKGVENEHENYSQSMEKITVSTSMRCFKTEAVRV